MKKKFCSNPPNSTPRPNSTVETGRAAEEAAVAFLATQSRIRLIYRNYRRRYGEIDLIGEEKRDDGKLELVFIEVRLRNERGWVNGLESVGRVKRARIERTARSFLCSYRGTAASIRFDVLAHDGRSWTHCRGAW